MEEPQYIYKETKQMQRTLVSNKKNNLGKVAPDQQPKGGTNILTIEKV